MVKNLLCFIDSLIISRLRILQTYVNISHSQSSLFTESHTRQQLRTSGLLSNSYSATIIKQAILL